ncbi:receptor-like protein 7 isoform X2 [Miscanthus floridulus]|uniref:receptor-like protein 7 isoform X2 n=1 Tax=Miscanthus floridulus TaxID=154761 RepID=UPI00345A1013
MTATNYRFRILVLLVLLCSYYFADTAAKINSATAPCLPDQTSSLLQLKSSFIVASNLSSWQAGTNCCQWEGIICDTGSGSGRVISLDLGGFSLMSPRLHPALFNLTSLRNLNLAFNDFTDVRLPASGFERLTDITHLNFSQTNFIGQIPSGISRLKNLVTLDFSDNNGLYLKDPSFQTFMANMSNLRELRLDSVDLSSSGSTWSTALGHSVPQLRILSLFGCGLSGSIHPSFSRLRSLASISLKDNPGLRGKVPEYFSQLSSLSSLDISGNHFEGQFPAEIFQLKSLMMLDLSANPMLFVRFTYFPAGNSLQHLNLLGTNFTYDTPLTFANLTSLQTLSLTTATMAKELPTSIKLPSLEELELEGSGLEKPVLSWVGNLKDLKYLELHGYSFSESEPSWIGNLTRLETLWLWGLDFSVPIPHQIGYLPILTVLYFRLGDVYGQQIPSWIGNLTKLTYLDLTYCNFSGLIPSTIGNLTQLEKLGFSDNSLTGNIPESLFALPTLQTLFLDTNQLSGSLEDIIPDPLSLGLSQIVGVVLSDNQLTGPIPESLFQLTSLQFLYLDSNKLMGTIKLSSIWGLTNLDQLDLSNNMISLIDTEGLLKAMQAFVEVKCLNNVTILVQLLQEH